jgi:hypothetical protein
MPETPKLEIFTLVRERCLLVNLNIRTEMHGDERQRAVDLAFEFSGANNLLSKLHPDLRAAFYKPQDTQDMLTADHMPVARFPLLGPISWDLEIPRTRLQLHGETPADDVVLGGGKTNQFKLEMMDGGTVKWKFRVQFPNPDDQAIAGLSHFLNDTVPVSLECRDVEEAGDNFEQVEKLSHQPMSEARQKAEDLFNAGGLPAIEEDPDFREVKEDTVSVEEVRAAENGDAPADDVVDATFTPPDDDLEQAPVSNVQPIGRKRGGRKVAGGGSLE